MEIPREPFPSSAILNRERKVINRKSKERDRVKHYYANENDFSKNNSDLPNDFLNQIRTGDSLDVLRLLPDNCVDLIFTSPPYNFGIEYPENDDAQYWEDYLVLHQIEWVTVFSIAE